jgi:hypothetical protein
MDCKWARCAIGYPKAVARDRHFGAPVSRRAVPTDGSLTKGVLELRELVSGKLSFT